MKNSTVNQVDWRDLLHKTPFTCTNDDYEELASVDRKHINGKTLMRLSIYEVVGSFYKIARVCSDVVCILPSSHKYEQIKKAEEGIPDSILHCPA